MVRGSAEGEGAETCRDSEAEEHQAETRSWAPGRVPAPGSGSGTRSGSKGPEILHPRGTEPAGLCAGEERGELVRSSLPLHLSQTRSGADTTL